MFRSFWWILTFWQSCFLKYLWVQLCDISLHACIDGHNGMTLWTWLKTEQCNYLEVIKLLYCPLSSPAVFCLFALIKKGKCVTFVLLTLAIKLQYQVQMRFMQYEVHPSVIINLVMVNWSSWTCFKTNGLSQTWCWQQRMLKSTLAADISALKWAIAELLVMQCSFKYSTYLHRSP